MKLPVLIKVEIVNDAEEGMSLDFDLINVEAPIANALRRVLLAEVITSREAVVFFFQPPFCLYASGPHNGLREDLFVSKY